MSEQASVSSPDRRQESRRQVELRAFAGPVSGRLAEARISDLSYDGCSIEGAPLTSDGERVELRVHRLGVIQAEVRWSEDGRAGCRFVG